MIKYSKKFSGILNTLAKYTLAALLIVIPLYPKFPLISISGTFVSIRMEDILILLSGIVFLLLVFPQIKTFFKNKVFRAITLFILVGLISLLSAIFITKTISIHLGVLHWLRRIEYFIPMFLAFYVAKNKVASMGFYLKILLIVLFATFIYGMGQRYLSWPIVITQNEEYSKGIALRWISGSHINSTFAGHYDLASFLVLILPAIIASLFVFKAIKVKLIFLISFFSGLWLLVSSASRISLVSYLMASTITLMLIKKTKFVPVIVVVSILFISFSSNLLDRYQRIFEVSVGKVKNYLINYTVSDTSVYAQEENILIPKKVFVSSPTPTPVFEDRSTNIRLNVEWPRAIRAFLKNPFLGTGYSSITLATDNDYLRMFGEVGMLGFVAFALIFVRVTQALVRVFPFTKSFKKTEIVLLAGFVGALPGIFLNAVFIDIFEASKFAILFWLMLGIVLGVADKKIYEQNN